MGAILFIQPAAPKTLGHIILNFSNVFPGKTFQFQMTEETTVLGKTNMQNYSCLAKHTEIPSGFRCSFLSLQTTQASCLQLHESRGTAATQELPTVGAKFHTALKRLSCRQRVGRAPVHLTNSSSSANGNDQK